MEHKKLTEAVCSACGVSGARMAVVVDFFAFSVFISLEFDNTCFPVPMKLFGSTPRRQLGAFPKFVFIDLLLATDSNAKEAISIFKVGRQSCL